MNIEEWVLEREQNVSIQWDTNHVTCLCIF